MTPPAKLLIPSDGNELELKETEKGKEPEYTYEYVKSISKKGVLLVLTETELEKYLRREIFKPI